MRFELDTPFILRVNFHGEEKLLGLISTLEKKFLDEGGNPKKVKEATNRLRKQASQHNLDHLELVELADEIASVQRQPVNPGLTGAFRDENEKWIKLNEFNPRIVKVARTLYDSNQALGMQFEVLTGHHNDHSVSTSRDDFLKKVRGK